MKFCLCTLGAQLGRCCQEPPQPGENYSYVPTTTTGKITIQPQPQSVAQGWQCPVCRAVMAPHMDKCANCGPKANRAFLAMDVADMLRTMEFD